MNKFFRNIDYTISVCVSICLDFVSLEIPAVYEAVIDQGTMHHCHKILIKFVANGHLLYDFS